MKAKRRKLHTYRIGPLRITMEPWSLWPKNKQQWSAVWALLVGIGGAVLSIASVIQTDEGLRSVLPTWVLYAVGLIVLIGGTLQRFQTLWAAAHSPDAFATPATPPVAVPAPPTTEEPNQ